MDKYYVYRPLLDLIGYTEGTDKGDGYNETLAYGKMLDGVVTKGKGKDVVLTELTLKELDALQTRMLQDPDNKKLNSSACGRYQIVRRTARNIRNKLPERYPPTRKFDEECQDEMACFLLGQRGIDKYLSGRMKENTLINELAKEWASLPTTEGKGYYEGQHTPIKTQRVRDVLAEVRERHLEGQPKVIEKVTVEQPVPVPVTPPSLETPWYKSKEVLAPVGTLLGAGGVSTFFEKFGGIPFENLALLLGFTTVVLVGFLVWRKRKDWQAVKHTVEALSDDHRPA